MSYYITAHRGGNKFNVPVEEKHKYITDGLRILSGGKDVVGISDALPDSTNLKPSNVFNLNRPNYASYISNDKSIIPISSNNVVVGLNLLSNNVKFFYRPSMLEIEQGTGARQRIGDKIFLKSVQIMINLTAMKQFYNILAGNDSDIAGSINSIYPTGYTQIGTAPGTITTANDPTNFYVYRNNRMNVKQFMKFRIMIVRFDDLSDLESKRDEDLSIFIRRWFNEIFVPLAIVPASGTGYWDIPVVSNQSKMLRESTQYTGSYKILYDEMVELNEKDYSKYIKINLEPKINLTFKDSENTPTTEAFNNVFGFIIPPTYYKADMDVVSYNDLLKGANSSVNVAEFTTNIKFTYYDI